ncbi:DUF6046 domain-containing protein [Persicobacter sp. CCB-QB2]|uniref:DUF6046 domain-containing protein n=1 Tax=Persicobacter sp. CCB-QB2 TaxID=1561025 RepID=UPI0006A99D85|nr:DUF6046 domain-containing protein [Persicobacter sp. CCB-QB2]
MEFDIKNIYESLASYKGLPFPLSLGQIPAYRKKQWVDRGDILDGVFSQNEGVKFGEAEVWDLFGQPIICPIQLDGIYLGSGESGHINLQPMMVIDAKKRMTKSYIPGGDHRGSVKEFIAVDDYKIKITGILLNHRDRGQYPHSEASILRSIWKKNTALDFSCVITNELFQYVVIEKLKFKELSMAPGYQRYEIELVSDIPNEVELLSGE